MDNDTSHPQSAAQESQDELNDQQLGSVSGGSVSGGIRANMPPPRPGAPPPNLREHIIAHLRYAPVQLPPVLNRSHSAHF